MRWTPLLITVAAGVVAGSIMVSGPATAKGPGHPATQVATAWPGADVVLDRATTHRFATTVRDWDKTSDLPTTLMATMGCARLPHPAAAALCAIAVPVLGSYTIDRLLQADQQHACLRFSFTWSGPGVEVYDGPRCQ